MLGVTEEHRAVGPDSQGMVLGPQQSWTIPLCIFNKASGPLPELFHASCQMYKVPSMFLGRALQKHVFCLGSNRIKEESLTCSLFIRL